MKQNKEPNWRAMTLKSLQVQLRRLSQVEVPATLEARLLSAIPDRSAEVAQQYRTSSPARTWDFGVTAAAAVVIFALMFVVNYGLSIPSQGRLTQLADTSLCYPMWDPSPVLYDQNNTSLERPVPYDGLPAYRSFAEKLRYPGSYPDDIRFSNNKEEPNGR
jgi:hypothetical protein